MRAYLARWLVRWRSRYIEASYEAYCAGMPRMERMWMWMGKRAQAVAWPLARRLDEDAMTRQMVEECWWG